ncbi:MAG: 50S ribosomal protein L10 [Acidimicrobiales bacterium]
MGEPKAEKVAIVAEVREKFQSSEAVVLTEYRGLNVTDLAVLRNAMRDAGGEYKVYKNSLVRFAAKELDLEIEELLVGPTAIAFTGTRPDGKDGDPVSVAKALANFSKDNENLVIKGGMLDGKLLTTDEIVALSKIAPREELLAKLAGGMAAPMQQMAGLLKAVPQKFAYALSALIEASGGAPDDSSSEEAEAEVEVSEEEAEVEVSEEEAEVEVSEEEAEVEVSEEEVDQTNEQSSENENEDKQDAGEPSDEEEK